MSWWNLEHVPSPLRRSRTIRNRQADFVSAAGSRGRHTSHGHTLPLMIEALENARKPYVLTAVPGTGYHLSSRADDVAALLPGGIPS